MEPSDDEARPETGADSDSQCSSGNEQLPSVDTTSVTVTPDMLGEYSEPIEVLGQDNDAVTSNIERKEMLREVTLIRLLGSCPRCDGPVSTVERWEVDPNGQQSEIKRCDHCEREWICYPESE